jgi:seryl-tRNA synthetase
MSDRSKLKAELRAIETAIEGLEAERDKGMIDIGRYMRLRKEYETRKAELESGLSSGWDETDDGPVRPVESPSKRAAPGTLSEKSSFYDVKRKALQERQKGLIEEFEAANKQLMSILDEAGRVRIQRRIKSLEEEIEGLEKQIEDLDKQQDLSILR